MSLPCVEWTVDPPRFHFGLVVTFHILRGKVLEAEGSRERGPHGIQVWAKGL